MANLEKNNTLTGICNSALAMAGELDFLEDISEDNPVAKTCRLLVAQAIDDVVSHEYAVWDELYAIMPLAKHGGAYGRIERRTAWNAPADMLAAVECYQEDTGMRIPFRVIGGLVECNADKNVVLKYLRRSYDPSEWSPELRTLVVKLLSHRILSAIAKQESRGAELEQVFWQFYYPMIVGGKKNKNSQNNYLGDADVLSRYYQTRGNDLQDHY